MKKYNIGVVDIVLFFFTGGLWTLVILYKLWQNSQPQYNPPLSNDIDGLLERGARRAELQATLFKEHDELRVKIEQLYAVLNNQKIYYSKETRLFYFQRFENAANPKRSKINT